MCNSRPVAVALAAAMIAGCATHPTPPPSSVFTDPRVARFDGLAPELRTTRVEQRFVTDRKHPGEGEYVEHYGIGRSRSVAFGNATVKLADDMSWDELVAWTTGAPEVEGSIAPDLNLEVIGQRWVAERLSPAVERITVYSNAND